jgi:hypothetical protein
MEQPISNKIQTTAVPQLHLSTSSIVLLQDNATTNAVSFSWASFPGAVSATNNYVLEAGTQGSNFADPVAIAYTSQLSVTFTVQDFNTQLRKLIITGTKQTVEFRVRLNSGDANPVFSSPVALEVTTYQPYTYYDDSHTFCVPGNFQNWVPACAPKIISPANNGEYEGYINLSNAYPQFLLIKGAPVWSSLTTLYYIGANKFGFNGTMFSVFEGAGIYKMNVSSNTNTWSCKRINSWSLNGTAVSADPNVDADMSGDASSISWSITTNLNQGDFVFRANKSNDIVFGHNATSDLGVPDYNGAKISIPKAGNYTIVLSLGLAGNYSYSVQKNS